MVLSIGRCGTRWIWNWSSLSFKTIRDGVYHFGSEVDLPSLDSAKSFDNLTVCHKCGTLFCGAIRWCNCEEIQFDDFINMPIELLEREIYSLNCWYNDLIIRYKWFWQLRCGRTMSCGSVYSENTATAEKILYFLVLGCRTAKNEFLAWLRSRDMIIDSTKEVIPLDVHQSNHGGVQFYGYYNMSHTRIFIREIWSEAVREEYDDGEGFQKFLKEFPKSVATWNPTDTFCMATIEDSTTLWTSESMDDWTSELYSIGQGLPEWI